ncbi:MAG TPA: hypothetical protein DDZ39_10845, partial [Flavobacteriaceae bacterium]|nr:hypothetical protein [Flavobacteriaceae bacterium]
MNNILTPKNFQKIGMSIFLVFMLVFSFFFGILDAFANQSPSVTTHSANSITFNSARLNGFFDPHSSHTSAWFEWGTSAAGLENSTTKTTGTSARQFNRTITGLSANTTYFFRAVAQNTHGTEEGQIRSFRTLAP